MSSLSFPGDRPAGASSPGLPHTASNMQHDRTGDAQQLVAGGALARLPQRAIVARNAASDDDMPRRPTINVRLPAADDTVHHGAVHEVIGYDQLQQAIASWSQLTDAQWTKTFEIILRARDGVEPEEWIALLKGTDNWRSQPPEVLHANVHYALNEYPELPDDAQRALLEIIVYWNLGDLPQAEQVEDYRRIAQILCDRGRDGEALLGHLMMSARKLEGESRLLAAEGLARATIEMPVRERMGSLQIGTAA